MGGLLRGILVASLLVVLSAGALGCTARRATDAPVAAVMDLKGKVALVDLEQGRVIDSVQMVSQTMDICADPGTGAFVTAQSGGVGTDADDRIGIIGVRDDRRVRYVRLPRPNPGGVECVGDGRIYVDHGWQEKDGMFACVVDTRTRTVVKEGFVPDTILPANAVAGVVWSSGVEIPSDVPTLRIVDPRTLASRCVYRGALHPLVQCESSHGVFGFLIDRDERATVARFDSKTGAVDATAAAGFKDGAARMVGVNNLLVAVDYSGTDRSSSGCQLLVFDPETLKQVRAIRVPGGPSDIAVWRDRVVVVNWIDQTLQVIDPETGAVGRSVELPDMVPLQLRVAVLDR